MEKIINKLINESTKGVDTYSHNGSTWLIFTEPKQWVIELTECKTLWYNYNFFKNLFAYASLEVVQNQHLITKWVEDNVMNTVEKTRMAYMKTDWSIDDTIENGVKETKMSPTYTEYGDWLDGDERLDNIIQNGIKETQFNWCENKSWVEGVIKGGVRSSIPRQYVINQIIDDTINYGVKNIMPGSPNHFGLEDTLDNGIKETHDDVYHHKGRIDGVIKNGVKEIYHYKGFRPRNIGDIIENGVKETQPLPDQSGEIIGYGNYYDSKEDRTKAFIDYLEETIEKGVKIN